jgi:hypothetical protein
MARKITLRDCDVDFFRRFYHVAYIVRIAHWYIEGRQNNVALKLHDAAAMAFDDLNDDGKVFTQQVGNLMWLQRFGQTLIPSRSTNRMIISSLCSTKLSLPSSRIAEKVSNTCSLLQIDDHSI